LLGRFPALAGADLDVAAGEIVLVAGPNGADLRCGSLGGRVFRGAGPDDLRNRVLVSSFGIGIII
jgi:ABC-type hemin transport system ATPase subunit